MPIDPNDLARTAVQTYGEDFTAFTPWDGATGLDTAGGPQWGSYVTADGTRPFNQEQEWYVRADHATPGLPDPFSAHDGVLTITASPTDPALRDAAGGQPYTSGLIDTHHSFSQTYGYFEMRAELPAGQGIWPAFWLLPADGTWPPEIDVMEMLGHDPTTLYTTVHSIGPGQTPETHTTTQGVSTVADMSGGYHTYGVDWEPDTLTFYFDGREVYRTPTPATLDKPMYMIANLAVGGVWGGDADATTPFPAQMNIDYIHAYRAVGDAGRAGADPTGGGLQPVYHLADPSTGQNVYTASAAERQGIDQSMPAFVDRGAAWAAPAAGPDTQDVFRFVDLTTGDHLYTASAAERDGLLAGDSAYRSEGVAFAAYATPEAAGAGGVAVERFVDTVSGQHLYASGADIDAVHQGHAGANWVDEGHAFTLHAPVADPHGL